MLRIIFKYCSTHVYREQSFWEQDEHTICGIVLHQSSISQNSPASSSSYSAILVPSLSFFRFLPSQCSSVCHGGCLNKQTHEGPWRARRRDVGLFALVAPVREKVFLRGTQRSGAQRRDHKTNIYPPASSARALSSIRWTRNKRMDPLLVLKRERDVILR